MEDLARNLLDSQLTQWKDEKYINEDKGQISTQLNYKNGNLSINNKKVGLPWEEQEDPAPDASAPAAKAAASGGK
ncbi:DUF945 family protein [Aquitalea magnusonii]|uniref:DUF945 family protein n=1 Tax=Aquitalea magnusonii TaxID=332411 RepID=UPI0022B25E47|nr:DUF945 family protein [Aquitalea magnusonii]